MCTVPAPPEFNQPEIWLHLSCVAEESDSADLRGLAFASVGVGIEIPGNSENGDDN